LKNILLTGGTGYIASHTAVCLSEADFEVVLYDNLSNSNYNVVNELRKITGKQIKLIEGDIRDTEKLKKTFIENKIDAVIHFAGLKSVVQSIDNPIEYYDCNVRGSISLFDAMNATNIRTIIFSSSAAVYGKSLNKPIDESHQVSPINPYGKSKLQIEEILKDISISDVSWQITCLRYFNPAGSHVSGLIGENSKGSPDNLMPRITNVAKGLSSYIEIYGEDYDTSDGTGIRDFIHVMDLAEGHLAALESLKNKSGFHLYNLGTGNGYSVLEIIKGFEKATGISIPYQVSSRRPGDVSVCYAKVCRAENELNWKAYRGLHEMCASAWNFKKNC
jgi:UDP-glucose 4-epimerase